MSNELLETQREQFLTWIKNNMPDCNYFVFLNKVRAKHWPLEEYQKTIKQFADERVKVLIKKYGDDDIIKSWINIHAMDWATSQGGEPLDSKIETKIAFHLALFLSEKIGNSDIRFEMIALAIKHPEAFSLFVAELVRKSNNKTRVNSGEKTID